MCICAVHSSTQRVWSLANRNTSFPSVWLPSLFILLLLLLSSTALCVFISFHFASSFLFWFMLTWSLTIMQGYQPAARVSVRKYVYFALCSPYHILASVLLHICVQAVGTRSSCTDTHLPAGFWFLEGRVALGGKQVCLRVLLQFYPVNVIPSLIHFHSCVICGMGRGRYMVSPRRKQQQ